MTRWCANSNVVGHRIAVRTGDEGRVASWRPCRWPTPRSTLSITARITAPASASDPAADDGAWSTRRGLRPLRRRTAARHSGRRRIGERHRVAGQLHVRLLQRGPVPPQLGEGEAGGAQQGGDALRRPGPVTVTASGPVAATTAPALASTVITSVRRAVRISSRVPGRGGEQVGHRGVRDQPAAADHEQVARGAFQLAHQVAGDEAPRGPRRPVRRNRPRIHTMPSGSSPLTGSSSISTGGSPSSAAAMPSRWRMPRENPPTRLRGHAGQADQVEHLVDPALGQAVAVRQPQQVVVRAPAGMHGRRVEQRADLGQRRRKRPVRPAADRRAARRRPRPARGSAAWWWTCRSRSGRRTRSPVRVAR